MASFSVDEVLEMACQIERNGAKFYAKAAEQVKVGPGRDVLLDFVEWEKQHEKLFAEMRANLPEDLKPLTDDPEDEGALYLRAIVEGRVFDIKGDPSERLTGAETLTEIFQIAIGLEKDSIVFYLGMRDRVASPQGREEIDQVIREEMNHVRILSAEGGPVDMP